MQSLKGHKRPWLAALLNALPVTGFLIFPLSFTYLGYLYLESWRRFFLAFAVSATPVAAYQFLLGSIDEPTLGLLPLLFAWFICPLIFAIDGWRCAKEQNACLERERSAREVTAQRFGIDVEERVRIVDIQRKRKE